MSIFLRKITLCFIFTSCSSYAMAMPIPDELCHQNVKIQEQTTQSLLQRDSALIQNLQQKAWASPSLLREAQEGAYNEHKELTIFLEERKYHEKHHNWNFCNDPFYKILQQSIDLQIQLKNKHILTALYVEQHQQEIINNSHCSNKEECQQALLNFFIEKTKKETKNIQNELVQNNKNMNQAHKPVIVVLPYFKNF